MCLAPLFEPISIGKVLRVSIREAVDAARTRGYAAARGLAVDVRMRLAVAAHRIAQFLHGRPLVRSIGDAVFR